MLENEFKLLLSLDQKKIIAMHFDGVVHFIKFKIEEVIVNDLNMRTRILKAEVIRSFGVGNPI